MSEQETQLRPKTTRISHFDIHLENTGNLKLLVFSDTHIGQFDSTSAETPPTFAKIQELVNLTKPTHIFILGDIIHVNPFHMPSSWTDFYKMLETLNIPVHVIPGNHDRYIHSIVKALYHEQNVQLHNDELMRVFVDGYTNPIIFGHDVKNDMKIHGIDITRQWIKMLRTTFHDLIPDESLFVLGHFHDYVNSEDNLSYTIMPFSYSLNFYQYAVITPGEDGKFNIEINRLRRTNH